VLRTLLTFNDAPWRWAAGVRAALANALPMMMFSLGGHRSLGLVASLGTFTSLYGTTLPLRERLRTLPFVALGFVVASLLGILCAANAWLTITCLIAVTMLASILVFGAGLGSPGPMQFVLVAGVSARLASPHHVSGATFNPILIPVLVAAGALSAVIVVAAPLVLPSVRRKFESSVPLVLSSRGRLDRAKSIITARVVLAVAAAALLSVSLRVQHSYWMVMVAGAVLQTSHMSQAGAIRAVNRVLAGCGKNTY